MVGLHMPKVVFAMGAWGKSMGKKFLSLAQGRHMRAQTTCCH